MTTLAAPSQFEHQFARVVRRRRVVKLLRWTVPAVGSIIFAALTIPLLIAGLLPNAQFEGIRLEDDKLVVDQPRATGTLSDGGTYEMTAKSAKTKIINQDTIDLADMRAQMNFVDGEDLVATSAIGTYSLISSILTLTSQIDLVSSQGDTGEIGNGVADLDGQVFNGDDGVLFQFANGSTLEAINMHYDGAKQYWKFERASLTIPPQSEQDDEQ
jgi:hypothetical protein